MFGEKMCGGGVLPILVGVRKRQQNENGGSQYFLSLCLSSLDIKSLRYWNNSVFVESVTERDVRPHK